MATYKIGINAAKTEVYIAAGSDALPAGAIALPSFEHGNADPLGSIDNHVLYHHVREALYHTKDADRTQGAMFPDGIYNLQNISIIKHGPILESTYIATSVADIDVVAAATATFTVKLQPADSATSDFTAVSEDPAIATVAVNAGTATVTGVAAGETVVTVTHSVTGFTREVPVTVTAA